ncbi:MAG: NACHT domain-containing protein, partial [Stackebrandtia sp.]
ALTGQNPPSVSAVAARMSWLGGRIRPGWFERQLVTGRCVVMCDGLDEIPDEADRRRIEDWLKSQARRYPRNSFVVASRPQAWHTDDLPRARTWRLGQLSSVQIAGFGYTWCESLESRKPGHTDSWVRDEAAAEAGVLLSRLRAKPALHELVGNPLLLTMVALVHRHCGILPATRAGLYADTVQVLLDRHAACRVDPLRRLARHMMDRHISQVSTETARELLPGEPVDDLLTAGVDTGLLVATPRGVAFSHVSFQHYLAAMSMLDTDDDTEVAAKVGQGWWRETLLMWAAHTDVTKVVESCLRSGNMAALALAFDMAESAASLAAPLRGELKDLLSLATETLAENRLISAVKVTHEMRGMVRRYGGARLTATPVSNSLYASFLDT